MTQTRNPPAGRPAAMNVLVALAAGAGAALPFFLASRGTWAGVTLSYFAPLPLMVATLGYGVAPGGAAVLVGALLAGLLGSPTVGLVLGAGLLLPSFLVCVTALQAPSVQPDDRRATRVVLVSMALAVVSALAVVIALALVYGGAANARASITAAVLPMVRAVIQESRLPAGVTAEELARVLVGIGPATIAGSTFFMMVANVYVAARVALVSGQLAHPFPRIADSLVLPGVAAGLAAVTSALTFLGGLPGTLSSVVAVALGSGFALVGLAVIHVLSRAYRARVAILIGLYAAIMLVPLWPLLALALVGLVDAAFDLRRRFRPLSDQS